MKGSCEQSEQVADATYYSNAQYEQFAHFPCPHSDVFRSQTLFYRQTRNRYKSCCDDKMLGYGSTTSGSFWHCGHQQHRRRLGVFGDTEQSKSTFYCSFSTQMTTIHLIQAHRLVWVALMCRPAQAISQLPHQANAPTFGGQP